MEENTDAYELNSSLGVCGYIHLGSQICLSLGFAEKQTNRTQLWGKREGEPKAKKSKKRDQ